MHDINVSVLYSGGADSTLTLHCALQHHTNVTAVYADFICQKTNPKRTQNLEHVIKFCEKRGITLDVHHIKPEPNGKGPEGNARIAFKSVKEHCINMYDKVYMGHTLDDHLETVLMQLFRGIGKGCQGIPDQIQGKIHRPLLTKTKEEIIILCNELELEYFEDPSNKDTSMTRSFWRNEIIPKLKEHYGNKSFRSRVCNIGKFFEQEF